MTVSIEPGLRPLVPKLERLGPLSDEERQTLEGFIPGARWVGAARSLTRQGERPTACCLIVEGFACRYKALDDGQRQILSFHIPGDLLDLAGLLLGRMDYGVATLTAVRAVSVPNATLLDWIGRYPNLHGLLWRDTLLDTAVLREWVVNISRRSAYQRVAHLLCELVTRLHAAGLARDDACDLPITHVTLADATGLSVVHVNRVVRVLRSKGLVEPRGKALVALDWERLKRAADFDPAYLHLLKAAA